ncbi:MAG: hypothetical protein AAGE52_10720 [Myxococcota bacterium]
MTHFAKNLSLLASVVALGLGGAPTVLAQADNGPAIEEGQGRRHARGRRHHRRHRHHARVLQQLDLSDNQKAQIRAIRESTRERRQELRAQGRSPENRQAMRALHQETRRLIQEVLTPAQRTRAEQLRAEHAENRRTRRVARMTERLSLTDAQASQVTSVLEGAATQRRAIRESSQDHDAKRAAMRTLRQETRTSIDAILTPAQRTQAEEMRERRGRRGHRGHRGGR